MAGPIDPDGVREPSDARSYAERYRGTPWGGADPAPLRVAVAADRRQGGRLLAMAGAMLLAASGMAALALVLGGGPNALLGGSGPTARPVRTAPAGTADPDSARAAIDGLLAIVADPALTYSLRLESTTSIDDRTVAVAAVGRVAGRDSDLQLIVSDSAGGTVPFGGRVITIGTKAWVRRDDKRVWETATAPASDLVDPRVLAKLDDPLDLLHVGRVMRRGLLTHQLETVPGWLPASGLATPAAPGLRVTSATMELWVLPDGRPLEARLVTHLAAGRSSQTGFGPFAGVAEAEYVFSDVGRMVEIRPPK